MGIEDANIEEATRQIVRQFEEERLPRHSPSALARIPLRSALTPLRCSTGDTLDKLLISEKQSSATRQDLRLRSPS